MTNLLEPGIHFGTHEDLHRADPGLGSTDIKALLTSPVNGFWKRTANGRRIMEALGLADPEDEEPSADDEVDLGGDDDLGVETSNDDDENN